MNCYAFFKGIIITMAIFGYIYSLENCFTIAKLKKELNELKEKLNTK